MPHSVTRFVKESIVTKRVPFGEVTGADVTTFVDSSVAAGISYQYRVRASSAGGDSAYSAVAAVTTPSIVVTKPVAPSRLTAVALFRHASAADVAGQCDERVFIPRPALDESLHVDNARQRSDEHSAEIDTSAVRGRRYYYRVIASNSAGNSAASNIAQVSTPYHSSTMVRAAKSGTRTPAIEIIPVSTQERTGSKSSGDSLPAQQKSVEAVIGVLRARQVELAERGSQIENTLTQLKGKAASNLKDWLASVDAVFGREGFWS